MINAILRRFDPESWLDALPDQGGALDRQFARALRRRVHMPGGRPEFRLRDLLPWRRPAPEVIEIRERPVSTLPAPVAIERSVDALLGDARARARGEVARHVDALPRGRERAGKFPGLTAAHETRTARVLETEARRERRAAGQSAPAVDYRRRLVGEMHALEAEIASERRAETYAPLAEQELAVRQGQLALVRLLLDLDNARADLIRRRQMTGPSPTAGTTSDGGHDAPQRRPSIDLGMEL
jgi:hypothetical protein